MLTMQEPVPLQSSPLQPMKVESLAAVAVRVTWVPKSKRALHAEGQLSPAGLLVTVPLPFPTCVTLRVNCWSVKVAVILRACTMLTMHEPVPLHPSPFQPVKVDPLAGAAVSVMLVPKSKRALHVLPQLIPMGLLVTVPLPVPAWLTVRRTCSGVKVMAKILPPSVPA
jgi:hypothetical protein